MFTAVSRYVPWLLLLSLPLLSVAPSQAEVRLTEKTQYYSVTGKSKQEISKSIKRNAPHRKGKEYYPAYTQTDIKYTYSWSSLKGRCAVKKIIVFLTLTYVYPRLVDQPSPAVQRWWDDKIKRFIIHEKIHGDISKRAAYELDRTIRSLQNLDCKNAKNIISAKAKSIVKQMKQKQIEYDKITNHGRKQYKYRPPK